MSQLLNRISRIARSYISFGNTVAEAESYIYSKTNLEDEKLKQIINDLKNFQNKA